MVASESMKQKVSIAQSTGYAYPRVLAGVRDALKPLGGMKAYIKRGDRVLLKPNLLSARQPDRCVTTHPAVVKAVAYLVQEAGGIPAIGDSPGVGGLPRVAAQAGITEVADELGCPLVEFKDVARIKRGESCTFRRFELAKAVLDTDVVINLPKVKTHAQTLLTLGVKNTFGCIPGMRKAQWHFKAGINHAYFAGMLAELCQIVKPALTIVDGIIGMEGEGPGNGEPRPLGLIFASVNPHALDAVICQIIGVPPDKLPTIQAARQRGFAGADPRQIEVLDQRAEAVQVAPFLLPRRFFDIQWNLPGFVKRPLNNIFMPKPIIKEALCTLCGTCAKVCPPQAISLGAKKVRIDYRQCIRCYCCQEVCPEGAAHLREGWVARLSS
jgi:uncharacterized protein (DUF362 family)/NAD-dependent dihydropyrimidine dehydrogenase PreA subunit